MRGLHYLLITLLVISLSNSIVVLGQTDQQDDLDTTIQPNLVETVTYVYNFITSDDDGDGVDDTFTANLNFTYNRIGDIYFETNVTDFTRPVEADESYDIAIVGGGVGTYNWTISHQAIVTGNVYLTVSARWGYDRSNPDLVLEDIITVGMLDQFGVGSVVYSTDLLNYDHDNDGKTDSFKLTVDFNTTNISPQVFLDVYIRYFNTTSSNYIDEKVFSNNIIYVNDLENRGQYYIVYHANNTGDYEIQVRFRSQFTAIGTFDVAYLPWNGISKDMSPPAFAYSYDFITYDNDTIVGDDSFKLTLDFNFYQLNQSVRISLYVLENNTGIYIPQRNYNFEFYGENGTYSHIFEDFVIASGNYRFKFLIYVNNQEEVDHTVAVRMDKYHDTFVDTAITPKLTNMGTNTCPTLAYLTINIDYVNVLSSIVIDLDIFSGNASSNTWDYFSTQTETRSAQISGTVSHEFQYSANFASDVLFNFTISMDGKEYYRQHIVSEMCSVGGQPYIDFKYDFTKFSSELQTNDNVQIAGYLDFNVEVDSVATLSVEILDVTKTLSSKSTSIALSGRKSLAFDPIVFKLNDTGDYSFDIVLEINGVVVSSHVEQYSDFVFKIPEEYFTYSIDYADVPHLSKDCAAKTTIVLIVTYHYNDPTPIVMDVNILLNGEILLSDSISFVADGTNKEQKELTLLLPELRDKADVYELEIVLKVDSSIIKAQEKFSLPDVCVVETISTSSVSLTTSSKEEESGALDLPVDTLFFLLSLTIVTLIFRKKFIFST